VAATAAAEFIELWVEICGAMELGWRMRDALDQWANENGLSNDDVADWANDLFDEPYGSQTGDFGAAAGGGAGAA